VFFLGERRRDFVGAGRPRLDGRAAAHAFAAARWRDYPSNMATKFPKRRPASKATKVKGHVRAPKAESGRRASNRRIDPGLRIFKMLSSIGPEHFSGLPE
jgi:hypothetical protein